MIQLHGKMYVTVAERVQAAHADEGFSMLSEEIFSIGDRHFVRVVIDVKGKQFIGSAEIKFGAKPNTPDGTNPLECAATSAVGRALGFASYGSVDSIALADEIVRSEPRPQPKADPLRDELNRVYAVGKAAGCYSDTKSFTEFVRGALILDLDDPRQLTAAQLADLEEVIEQVKRQQETAPAA